MNRLSILHEGDTIDVVAPGSACARDDLDKALELLTRWQLKPRVPDNIFGRRHIYAQSDEVRAQHLASALGASDSQAVWCVRGGYGTLRLLPLLDRLEKPRKRKLLIGFSDITALQLFMTEHWGWPVLHGAVLAQLGRDELSARSIQETKRVLLGQQSAQTFDRLRPLATNTDCPQRIRGRLIGGNMKTVTSLLGTPWQPPASPSIWYFEDVAERGYSVDRMLQQMRLAGLFGRTKAIVLGPFAGGEEPDGRRLAVPIFREFAESVEFPVLTGLPVGHGRHLRPLPLGLMADLELNGQARLCIQWQ